MDTFNKIYKKTRRVFTRNKAEWDDNKQIKAFYLKNSRVAVIDLEETSKRQGVTNTSNYKYNVMSDKKPAIPCNTIEEVMDAIEEKLNEK